MGENSCSHSNQNEHFRTIHTVNEGLVNTFLISCIQSIASTNHRKHGFAAFLFTMLFVFILFDYSLTIFK
ncbi:hypothetical protein VIDI103191_08160 [Vibrio diazotrophicus]